MTRRVLLVVLLIQAAARPAPAADDAGVASPLALGSGARAMGLGRTGVAFASDTDAVFWNAARLAHVEHAGASLFHTSLLADGADYNAGFLAYPSLDAGTFALGFQRLGVSGIERRDDRNQLLGTFGNTESSVLLGYGRGFGRHVSLGAAVRLVQQSVDAASDASFGLDLGLGYEIPLGTGGTRLGFGVNFQNALTPRLQLDQAEVADPRSLKLGLAWTRGAGARGLGWLAAIDLDVPERADPRVGLGVETTYRGLLSLRAGVDRAQPTFGVGITWRIVRFDYALVDQATLDRGDRFSVELRLGRSVGERRVARQRERELEVSTQLARQLEERETQERARALAEGAAASSAGRWDDALRSYRLVLALDPTDVTASQGADAAEREQALERAIGLVRRGQMGEGAAALQAMLERWPGDPRATAELEAARLALQRTEDRARQVNELFKQALAAFSQSDPAAADVALQELLRLDPGHDVALELQGRVRANRKALGEQALAGARTRAAKRDFDGALVQLADAQRWLGPRPELVALAGEWRSARTAAAGSEDFVGRAPAPRPAPAAAAELELDPAHRRALQQRYQEGLDAFGRGDFQRAIRSWRAVWAEWPEYENVAEYLIKAYLYEGIALYSSGKYDEAIDLCRRVLQIDPGNAKAKRYVERILEEQAELQQIESPRP